MRPRAARHDVVAVVSRCCFNCRSLVFVSFNRLAGTKGWRRGGYREWPSTATALRIHLHVKPEGKTKTGAT